MTQFRRHAYRLVIALLCLAGVARSAATASPGEAGEVLVIKGLATVHKLAFSPDGTLLAAAGSDVRRNMPADGLVKILQYSGGTEVGSLSVPAARPEGSAVAVGFSGLAFAPDGSFLVVAQGGGIRLWDVAGRKEIASDIEAPWGLLVVPTGKEGAPSAKFTLEPFAFAEDSTLQLPAHAREYLASGRRPPIAWITWGDIAVAPEAEILCKFQADFKVELWDVTNGKIVANADTGVAVQHSLDMTADGTRIVVLGEAAARIGELRREGETVRVELGPNLDGQAGGGGKARFSADGRFLAILGNSMRNNLRLWDASTGKWIRTIPHERSRPGIDAALAFSPDGRILAVGGVTVRCWKTADITRAPSQKEIDAQARQAVQDMLAALAARDGDAATLALDVLGPQSAAAVPLLLEHFKPQDSPGKDNRTGAAAMALARIGPGGSAAVPSMIEALKSTDRMTRLVAIGVLSAIGPAASDAVPLLLKALDDPDALTRSKARKALIAIDPSRIPK